ncbi:MAG: YqgE/AlgH family protein [Candidatus Tectomicrobia bacterium]
MRCKTHTGPLGGFGSILVALTVVLTGLLCTRVLGRPWPGRFPFETELASGVFLVARPQLRSPFFTESVVLVFSHDQRGAQGLIINRPSQVRLTTVFPELGEERSDVFYFGGPVASNRMLLLLQSAQQRQGTQRVFEDIYVSTSRQALTQILTEPAAGERFRAYAGYAQWAPGQLEQEIVRGDWYVLAAEATMLFTETPAALWPALVRRRALKWL